MFNNNEEIVYTIISFTVFVLLLITIIIVSAVLYYNRRKKHIQEKKLMQSEFQQEMLQAQLEMQEQTLRTVAEEIHDNIGQVLSLAKLHLNTAVASDETSANKLSETKNLVGKAINDLRSLSRSLHGEKLTEIGLQDTIAAELKSIQNTGQFNTNFTVTGTPYPMDNQKAIVLFRIVQEALHNALKYSKANAVWVEINYQPAVFSLAICDDGVGFNQQLHKAADTGIGLKNMKNRTNLIGGNISVNSSPGNGTKIFINIPQNLVTN